MTHRRGMMDTWVAAANLPFLVVLWLCEGRGNYKGGRLRAGGRQYVGCLAYSRGISSPTADIFDSLGQYARNYCPPAAILVYPLGFDPRSVGQRPSFRRSCAIADGSGRCHGSRGAGILILGGGGQ